MQGIQRITILGAGAMGAVYAARFKDSGKFETCLLAEGDRAARLAESGYYLNGKHYHLPVQTPAGKIAPAGLVIVALKNHHLIDALPLLDHAVDDHTVILSVMNGLDSEKILAARFGPEKLLYTIAVGIDAVRQGNRVTCSNPGMLFFGERRNHELSEKVVRVQKMLEQAGLRCEVPEDMERKLWWKFMINVGMNQASAVLGAPYGVFQKSAEARTLMTALMMEVIQLAQSSRVELSPADIDDWIGFLNTLSPQGKTSMLQDVEAGRKTEVELFGGKVITLGEELDIPTPVNRTLVQMITILEQMNRF